MNAMDTRQLVILSGRSGSGKTVALRELEDNGFYCVDNLPISLIKPLLASTLLPGEGDCRQLAVAIDVRNLDSDMNRVGAMMHEWHDERGMIVTVIYLNADNTVLLQRFKEARRLPPLKSANMNLEAALNHEISALAPMREIADLVVDTTACSMHELRSRIREVCQLTPEVLLLELVSFGYKNGVPQDADIMFDVRCLPNPYWEPALRALSGTESAVSEFMDQHRESGMMLADIAAWIRRWLPYYRQVNRSCLTVAVGCTGGQHRSVYLCQRLHTELLGEDLRLVVRHRDLHHSVETAGAS